jgi:hypothetical protein
MPERSLGEEFGGGKKIPTVCGFLGRPWPFSLDSRDAIVYGHWAKESEPYLCLLGILAFLKGKRVLDNSHHKVTPKMYQAAKERLEDARDVALRGRAAVERSGDIEAGERNLAQLRAAVDEFRGLRSRMTKQDIFVAEFSIEVLSPHEVSLVLPHGVSRLDFLQRAQEISREFRGQNAIADFQLASSYPLEVVFREPMRSRLFIAIDGCVGGTVGKDFPAKVRVLHSLGLEEAPAEDVIVAHVAFYVATGNDLFMNKEVRARSVILSFFENEGLLKYDTTAIREISMQPRAMGIAARRKRV